MIRYSQMGCLLCGKSLPRILRSAVVGDVTGCRSGRFFRRHARKLKSVVKPKVSHPAIPNFAGHGSYRNIRNHPDHSLYQSLIVIGFTADPPPYINAKW